MAQDERYKKIAHCFDLWMTEREHNNYIGRYLEIKNVKRLGIYGYGMLGRHLLHELRQSPIEIAWITDKRGDNISCGFPVFTPDKMENLSVADIIIVTAISDFPEIEKMFCEKGEYPVVSLLEIIEEMGFFRKKA